MTFTIMARATSPYPRRQCGGEDGNDIEAYYGNVNITGAGTVYLYDNDIYSGDESSSAHSVNITSTGGTVDLEDT